MPNIVPTDILQHPYERVLIPEAGGGYSAYISEFEGCLAEGETPEEAFNNLEASAIAWIEAESEAGRDIPAAWNDQEFSGKLLLRLPKSLHGRLARQAEKEGISLNQYVLYRLAEARGEDKTIRTIPESAFSRIPKILDGVGSTQHEITSLFESSVRALMRAIGETAVIKSSGAAHVVSIKKCVSRGTTTGQIVDLEPRKIVRGTR